MTRAILLYLICISLLFAGGSSPVRKKAKEAKLPLYAVDYNQGTKLLKALQFQKAIPLLKKSILQKSDFAQAHNNLAYCYRKTNQFGLAMKHYNQAIKLNQNIVEAYMYRGVLHIQMKNIEKAQEDLKTLRRLDKGLAKELEFVIVNRQEKEPEQFFGVTSLKK